VAGAARVEACVRLEQSGIGERIAHERACFAGASCGIEDPGSVVQRGW
jgi:hypothetical protein